MRTRKDSQERKKKGAEKSEESKDGHCFLFHPLLFCLARAVRRREERGERGKVYSGA